MLLFIYGERQRHKIMPRTISCEGMDVSGDDPDLAITVLTCEGDLRDPAFPNRLTQIICKLKRLVSEDKKPFQVTKVEPWNSVRVTFNIPRNAAQRLRQLAERGDNTLRELGILSVQIEGDQVITLTLANSFNESREQLLIGKSSESVANSVVASSLVNSSALNINSSELTVNYNNVNSLTSSSVSSAVSSSIDLSGSPSSGSSVEITRKNIAQYLSQQHLDVVNSTSIPTSVELISERLPAFRSPNVVAPINTEPIPFLNVSSTSTLTSQLLTSVSSGANTCTASSSAGSRLSAVTSIANSSLREIQSNYGLFPFASMQHSYQAMHTKQGLQALNQTHNQTLNQTHFTTTVQRPNQVITTTPSVRLPLSFGATQPSQSLPNSTAATVSSTITSPVSNRLQLTTTRDAKNVKVCQTLSSQSQPQQPIPSLSQTPPHPTVAQVVNQSCNNNLNSASANVALTSPLLVNLLQSDATSGHMKGPTAQTTTLNQMNTSNDLTQKRKTRKARKSKDKIEPEVTQSAYFVNTSAVTQTLAQSSVSTAQTSVATTSSTSPSLKHLPSNPLPQQSGIESQMQTQSKFNISSHLISIPINAMPSFPSIHPEAQGQPQVVRAGHLPLRSQLSRPPISAPKVGSPAISTTHLRKPLFVTTSQTSSKPYSTVNTANTHSKPLHEQKSSPNPNPNPNSANIKVDASSGNDKNPETNAVFPSPPTARMSGKTKHLINPFTGLLEPMLSDEEEEDRPSPATLFPELDGGSDVGGNSERSLSDAGSNGKDNNHSSDTDSGLGKSGTDVSSQSSIDVGNGDNTPTHLKDIGSKACVSTAMESMSSGESAIDKLKLKLKIEAKTETQKADNLATNTPFHSRSHFTKQKSSEVSNSLSNPCVSVVATESIPVMMAEPRVPPLHISIRGPNSAVVVSNRRESTSELEMKTNVVKKGRAVRTTRAMSVESGLGTECTNLNKNQRKKLQREQRFLSGGGIVVTPTLSVCASPSVESLVDINKTLNDSTFALSSGSTTHSSESVDPLPMPSMPSSDVRSNCAQNQSNDNTNNSNVNNNNNVNNSKNINISPNKCVPKLNSEDNTNNTNNINTNSSQVCAIPSADSASSADCSVKTSVVSKSETIVNKINSDLQTFNTRPLLVNSIPLGLGSNAVEDTDCVRNKPELKTTTESSAPDRPALESKAQTSDPTSELTNLESVQSPEPLVSLAPIESHKMGSINENEKSLEKVKTKSRKASVAALTPVEPLMNANNETIISKISRIGRINCITSSIPALVNSVNSNCVRIASALHSTQSKPTSPLNCLIESTIECKETIDSIQTTSTVTKINSIVPQIDNLSTNVVISELKPQFDISNKSESKQQMTKSDVVLNGDISGYKNERPNSPDVERLKPKIENKPKPHSTGHELHDSSETKINILVKLEEKEMELNENKVAESCESNKTDVLSEVSKPESSDKNDSESVSNSKQMSINTNSSSDQSVSEITAISDDLVKTESKSPKTEDLVDSNTQIDSKHKTFDSKPKTSEESVSDVVNSHIDDKPNESSEETKRIESVVNSVSAGSEETVRQPLQIVISTTVPSLTTSTSTPMFSQLKSSSFESGSRVTLITFKPNLNSPNTSSASTGRASDFSNNSLTNQMPAKGVPFKLLTIPSGSGGITVRSAANKLVELINSNASPSSPLSPNHMSSNGSPIPINATSPPMRLLVSKMATTGGVTQTVPVSVAGNSIGQLVVVKSVVVTNPSPSIKLVPARNPSLNTASLLIPVTRNNSPIESLNSINNKNICEQMSKQLSHSVKPINEMNNCITTEDNDHSCSQNEVQPKNSNIGDNNRSPVEPVDLTVQCPDSQTLLSADNTKAEDNESVPQITNDLVVLENDVLSDDEVNDDNPLTHSVASDHNYIMKNSNEEFEDQETEESVMNLSNTTEADNFDALRDNDILTDEEYKTPDFQSDNTLENKLNRSHDSQSRPNKRKSSENAAELIKACMGVDDTPKKNSLFNYSTSFTVPSGVSARTPNMSTRTRTSSLDNDCVITTTTSDSVETNHLNKYKNLRIRKSKVSSSEQNFTQDNCSSDDDLAVKDSSGLTWAAAKPRLRTGTAPKNQKINKQKNTNCIKDSNKEKIANRVNEKGKKGRDRDQSKTSSTQRSTRRSRDHNIMISTNTGISLHSSESSSEPLHMEIVGLELSNDSSTNNYNTDPSTASTPSPIITSSLLVKRKTRVGLNNNTEQSESGLAKRRRIVKENHR